jgi:hypothetical protein
MKNPQPAFRSRFFSIQPAFPLAALEDLMKKYKSSKSKCLLPFSRQCRKGKKEAVIFAEAGIQ